MGKTPGKWIKTLLLGKKSPKSSLVVSVKDDFSNLSLDPPVASSLPDTASTAQNVVAPSNDDVDLKPRNDLDDLKLQQAASKVQAVFRARQARRAFRTLKGIIRLQAVIRGHLVRRQAVATYSCVWGIVKFQALVRGRKTRSSSDNGIQCQKPHMEVGDSEALQLSKCRWMNNPTKFIIVDKLLASSPTALPLKIQYDPEEPNSAKVWLERWTQLQVWSPPSRAARVLVPKSKTKKRNYQEVVESEKARPKQGVKKQSGRGSVSTRSTTESEKPKRIVKKASSTLSKDPLRTERDKAKHNPRKTRSATKEGSPSEVKDEKPSPSLKRSSLPNTSLKVTRKSAEKKKDTVDSVQIESEVKVSDALAGGEQAVESAEKEKDTADSAQIEPEVKVSDALAGGEHGVESAEKEKEIADSVQIEPKVKVSDALAGGEQAVELAEKEKETADSVQIEPKVKVSDVLEGGGHGVESAEKEKETADSVQIEPEGKVSDVLEGGHCVESAEKEKETADVVPKELDVEEKENSPEEDELRTAETSDKGEDFKCSDVKVSSENGYIASDNAKPNEKRVSLRANVDNQDDGRTHSGRKIPSYMAPTASAKARLKGEDSPRFSQEKTEKNGTLRRHSLPSPANGKPSSTTNISPGAHRLLLASAKGSMNGEKSFSSSKNISDKSNRNEWER